MGTPSVISCDAQRRDDLMIVTPQAYCLSPDLRGVSSPKWDSNTPFFLVMSITSAGLSSLAEVQASGTTMFG